MSPLLAFAEDELQIGALLFMAVVYAAKIRWILRFPAGRDRQPTTAGPHTNARTGAVHSLFSVAMPWSMASTREHPLLYAQFVIFHVAVAASIAMSFAIPYAPAVMLIHGGYAVMLLRGLFTAAALIGLLRLVRRASDPYVRAISSIDDYFSLALLTVWLAFSSMAAPNRPQDGEFWLLGYFFLTAFFLVYVPFSKISHYLYYPFARWYLGRTLGHRGVYPFRKRVKAQTTSRA